MTQYTICLKFDPVINFRYAYQLEQFHYDWHLEKDTAIQSLLLWILLIFLTVRENKTFSRARTDNVTVNSTPSPARLYNSGIIMCMPIKFERSILPPSLGLNSGMLSQSRNK